MSQLSSQPNPTLSPTNKPTQPSLSPSQKPPRLKNTCIDLRSTQYKILRDICERDLRWKTLTKNKQPHEQPHIIWTDSYISEEELRCLLPHQKINHFPGSFQLGNKHFLSKNMAKMKKKYEEEYGFFPETWLMPDDFERFKLSTEKSKNSSTWIFKPSSGSQGRGIIITKNPDLIEQKLRTRKHPHQFVVQKYVDRPYLIDGLKFDLRVYVLIKSFEPLKVFMYREGLARFATYEYEKPLKSNLRNTFMHLTNYAINKKNPLFLFSEENQNEGHKRTMTSVLNMLKSKGEDIDSLLTSIQDLIIKTICSVQPLLSHLYKSSSPSREPSIQHCFQILGFDILIDEHLKPHLLQVNHTPSFRTDSKLDYHVKSNLLRDALEIVRVREGKQSSRGARVQRVERVQRVQRVQRVSKKEVENGFVKLYPVEEIEDRYRKYMEYSHLVFDIWTGIIKKNFAELASLQQQQQNGLQKTLTRKISNFAKVIFQRQDSKRSCKKQLECTQTKTQVSKQQFQKLRFSLIKQRFQQQIFKKQHQHNSHSPNPHHHHHLSPNKTSLIDTSIDPQSPHTFHNFLHKRDLSATRRYQQQQQCTKQQPIKQDLKTLLNSNLFNKKKSSARYMSRPHMVSSNYRPLKLIEFPI